jgi:hypothetical protein
LGLRLLEGLVKSRTSEQDEEREAIAPMTGGHRGQLYRAAHECLGNAPGFTQFVGDGAETGAQGFPF